MGKIISNGFPTMEGIQEVDHLQICRWYRFLRSPETDEEREVMKALIEKFNENGGMTPTISKAIGWAQ